MPNAFHPRAAIFDLDGTLADTFDLVISAYSIACETYLGRKLSREEVIARFGPTEVGMLRKELPPALHARAIAQFRQCYRDNHRRAPSPRAGSRWTAAFADRSNAITNDVPVPESVTVPRTEIERQFTDSLGNLQRDAQVPGFRRNDGK